MDLQNQPGTFLNNISEKDKLELSKACTGMFASSKSNLLVSCQNCGQENSCGSIFQNEHICMLIIDRQSGKIVDANPAAEKYYGYSREQFLKLAIWDINTLGQEQVRAEMVKAAQKKHNFFNFRHKLADGKVRDVEVYSGSLNACGQDLLYSIVHDITDRLTYMRQRDNLLNELSSEQARLKLSNEQLNKQRTEAEFAKSQVESRWLLLETVVDQMVAGVAIVQNETGHIILTNRLMAEILGQPLFPIRTFSEFWQCLAAKIEKTGPGGAGVLLDAFGSAREVRDYELRIASGSKSLAILSSSIPVRNHSGQNIATALMFYDITEKKRVEAELRKHRYNLEMIVAERTSELEIANKKLYQEINSRKRAQEALIEQSAILEAFFLHAPYPVAILDKNVNFVRVNSEYASAHTQDMGFFAGKSYFQLYPNVENESIFQKVLSTAMPYRAHAKPMARAVGPHGTTYWDWTLVPVSNQQGKVELLILSLLDVTENKIAQEEIGALSQFRQTVIDGADILLTVMDTDGKIVLWNRAAENITGYSREDMIGKFRPWRLLYPRSDYYENSIKPAIEALENGIVLDNYETTMRTRSGQVKAMCWNLRRLHNAAGASIGTIVLGRDISEQKAAEEKINEYQQQLRKMSSQIALAEEKLRRHISEELHDGLGQFLAIAKIKLGVIKEQSQPGTHAVLDEIRSHLENAISYTRTLTCELSPPVLYEFGLEAAIEWICESVQNSHSIKCKFENDSSPKPMSDDLKILLFQIVRELMHNVIKHAKACNIAVGLSRNEDVVQITLKDDGIGFDTHKLHGNSGFGLFNIRERLNHLQGNLEIKSCSGGGTDVIVSVPLVLV
ncbi:MAG: hypothetical protein A2Y07_00805 [Planctomycetes bacterium GWF2_50_10]|nr:MAG: hypothetical protein A2Y07_00805 [Planctomycetes bacterium GWF2_50_10]